MYVLCCSDSKILCTGYLDVVKMTFSENKNRYFVFMTFLLRKAIKRLQKTYTR